MFTYLPPNLEIALQRPTFMIFQTAALSAGTNDVILITIPTNEVWELMGGSGSIVTGGPGETAALSINQPLASFDNQVLIGPTTTMVLNAQRRLLDEVGIIVPPGAEIRLHVEAAVLNDTIAVRLLAYKFPRAFLGRASG
jgi:hypothetical protein